jgi:hypothetical protein
MGQDQFLLPVEPRSARARAILDHSDRDTMAQVMGGSHRFMDRAKGHAIARASVGQHALEIVEIVLLRAFLVGAFAM